MSQASSLRGALIDHGLSGMDALGHGGAIRIRLVIQQGGTIDLRDHASAPDNHDCLAPSAQLCRPRGHSGYRDWAAWLGPPYVQELYFSFVQAARDHCELRVRPEGSCRRSSLSPWSGRLSRAVVPLAGVLMGIPGTFVRSA